MKIKYLYTNFFDWKFILSILISLLFSFYAFRNFELSKLSNIIGEINFSYIFLAIFFRTKIIFYASESTHLPLKIAL